MCKVMNVRFVVTPRGIDSINFCKLYAKGMKGYFNWTFYIKKDYMWRKTHTQTSTNKYEIRNKRIENLVPNTQNNYMFMR